MAMKIALTQIPIADFCSQFERNEIQVNRDYQRSNKVWPTSARSYFIDTILMSFPIAKILLRQKTVLPTRTTTKEVIDGQQRSQAIFDFSMDNFSITLKTSDFYGKRFSTLEPEEQHAFLDYQIAADLLIAATDEEVRELFRRMNSYTAPLNKQELRHASHQGPFKWFILDLTKRYSGSLKDIKVLTEAQIARMGDAELFTALVLAVENGIETSAPRKLDAIYRMNDEVFVHHELCQNFIDSAMTEVLKFGELIRSTKFSNKEIFYSLVLALGNARVRIQALQDLLDLDETQLLASYPRATENLYALISAVDEWDAKKAENRRSRLNPAGPFAEFVAATTEGTNTKESRQTRFRWISKALLPSALL